MAGIQANGIGSGLDVNSLVAQLVSAEAAPLQQRIARHEVAVTTKVSALGSLKGALSAFKAALEPLRTVEAFQARKATSADTKIFTVSADASAVAGHYDIEVVDLARAHQLASDPFAAGSSSAVGHGTLTLSAGDASFDVTIAEDATTLADIRDAINAAPDNTTVRATLVNGADGTRLVLASTRTGADHAIEVSASGGDGGLGQLTYDPDGTMNLTQLQGAQNARIRIAGYVDVESSTNVFEDAIDGVTITAVASSEGEQVALDVAFDRSGVQSRIQKFVSEYNAMQTSLGKLGNYNAETKSGGPLLGDALLRSIQSETRQGLTSPVAGLSGDYTSLAGIGITTDASGALKIDTATLNEALDSDPDAVAQLFGSEDGVAARLYERLEARLATDGDIATRNTTLTNGLKDIEKDKQALALRLSQIESRYRKQFTALDSLLSQMQSTASYLTQQLGSLQKMG